MTVLDPQLLISAYCQGVFPMAHDDGNIYWYDPDPRAILPFERFRISRSLKRTLKKEAFEIRINYAFQNVVEACAKRDETWISPTIIKSYVQLYRLGYAHSVECWQNERLVGGLYGVAIRGFFAGESMFSHATDASKVALVHLVERLQTRGYRLLDIQFMTDHLSRFGAVEIPADAYKLMLHKALQVRALFFEGHTVQVKL